MTDVFKKDVCAATEFWHDDGYDKMCHAIAREITRQYYRYNWTDPRMAKSVCNVLSDTFAGVTIDDDYARSRIPTKR